MMDSRSVPNIESSLPKEIWEVVPLIDFCYKNLSKVMENYTSLPCLKEHVNPIQNLPLVSLTLILLTWKIWWAPNNASKWQMGFNSAFKGLMSILTLSTNPSVDFHYVFFTSIFSPNSYIHSLHTYAFHMSRRLAFLDWITLSL